MTFADTLPSEPEPQDPALQRAVGQARLSIRREGGGSRLERLFQEGAAKIRLPNVAKGALPEAVLINTAGGLTGGDRFSVEVDIGEGAGAVVTSQACEKIYRSSGGAARVENSLRIGEGGFCAWLPQETILFDKARLERRIDVDLARDARLLAVEPIILGRLAMGETVQAGSLRDRWRIRRQGRLVHADDFRLEGDVGMLTGAAPLLADNRAAVTIVLMAEDAEDHLAAVREALGESEDGAVSAWDGRMIVRLLALSGQKLRALMIPLIELLLARLAPGGKTGAALPRVWTT
jgi:urease accessory protein